MDRLNKTESAIFISLIWLGCSFERDRLSPDIFSTRISVTSHRLTVFEYVLAGKQTNEEKKSTF